MVELAKANNIRVVLSSVLPVNDRVRNKEGVLLIQTKNRPSGKITAMNNWLKRYAAENNLIYLDYYPATADEKGTLKDSLSYDGLHPNADGYKVMQSLAEKARFCRQRGGNQRLENGDSACLARRRDNRFSVAQTFKQTDG